MPWPDLGTQHNVVLTVQLVVPPFPATEGRWGVAAQSPVVAEPTGPRTVASLWSHPPYPHSLV
eukprot:CAMPEP_0174381360 /NCGR_PEP_ID=MMETSP0811_2-20130205/123960_1 /TAXON_ID=73025 ORGANISM="Eutreptiella gymnastica-like, Strain CCMP1594" /NCGR_SAMPLE_ID=MMETSP0811_2 /ASSEMBLY_ACC=CAM_ASM_000667 /LENGTH=62 /DNA_ID=CAMNT_0015534477 /DNA_START=1819 /DNA_END=2003 /DNA_ORIENTATION=+